MSKIHYEIHVSDFDVEQAKAIIECVCLCLANYPEEVSKLKSEIEGKTEFSISNTVDISERNREDGEIIEEIKFGIWYCNEDPCKIEIQKTYLDKAPTEEIKFGEEEYRKWLSDKPFKKAWEMDERIIK